MKPLMLLFFRGNGCIFKNIKNCFFLISTFVKIDIQNSTQGKNNQKNGNWSRQEIFISKMRSLFVLRVRKPLSTLKGGIAVSLLYCEKLNHLPLETLIQPLHPGASQISFNNFPIISVYLNPHLNITAINCGWNGYPATPVDSIDIPSTTRSFTTRMGSNRKSGWKLFHEMAHHHQLHHPIHDSISSQRDLPHLGRGIGHRDRCRLYRGECGPSECILLLQKTQKPNEIREFYD